MVKFDAEETLRLIARHRVQWVSLVPTMMHRIWALPENVRNGYDLLALKIVLHIAAPMPPWLKQKWIDWLGPERIWEMYGGTEAGRDHLNGVEWLAHNGSVGKSANRRLRILSEDGNDVAARRDRRDLFHAHRGAGRPIGISARSRRRADGWESLGDTAGSTRTAISTRRPPHRHDPARRRNVYPAEVEAAILEHPEVADASSSACPIRSSGSACTRSSSLTGRRRAGGRRRHERLPRRRLSRCKHPESFEAIRSRRATTQVKSVAPCCETSARRG